MRGRPQELEQYGEGPALNMWVPTRTTRKRRHEQCIENDVKEGSRQFKGMKKEDKYNLLNHLSGIGPSFGEKFFKQINNIPRNELPPEEPEPIDAGGHKEKKLKVDVAIVAPKSAQKEAKQFAVVEAALIKSIEAGEEALAT